MPAHSHTYGKWWLGHGKTGSPSHHHGGSFCTTTSLTKFGHIFVGGNLFSVSFSDSAANHYLIEAHFSHFEFTAYF